MGQAALTSSPSEVPHKNGNAELLLPAVKNQPKRCQSSTVRMQRQFKKVLKCCIFSCRSNIDKKRKHAKISKIDMRTSFFDSKSSTVICPNASPELQLHWFRSKHSLLSNALSKLAFFSRLSKDKLKEDERKNGKILKVYRDHNENVTETLRRISIADLSNNQELRTKLINKILSQHSTQRIVPANRGILRKIRSPEEIYERNLKKFERLLAITASTSSSSTSCNNTTNVFKNAEKITDENNNIVVEVDKNLNVLEKTTTTPSSGSGSLISQIKRRPTKRIISSSKNRVEVDVHFMNWIKSKMTSSVTTQNDTVDVDTPENKPVGSHASSRFPSKSPSNEKAQVYAKRDENNNTIYNTFNANISSKGNKFAFTKKGTGKEKSASKKSSSSGTSTTTSTSTPTASQTRTSDKRRCQNCGPCAGKGALSTAPPAYLDYGESGAANAAGSAWKGKRKGDPVMDRLKNVDVVEEMTYLVPMPDCGGNGDKCGGMDGAEEDDCEYYAVCDSCGEMEPVPEELKRELKGRKKRKGKAESTPVTYSRRQRFNFKNKGDMCDDDDGPPYPYEGLVCPGQGCRCSCCVSGLRRSADCGCKCCQTMGPARKCSSFDEFPVGKNPVIRRILCPEEKSAKKEEIFQTIMPECSGLYRLDVKNQTFERQVPRTPTPIVVEVVGPEPLTKEQIIDLGREVQEKKRISMSIGNNNDYCTLQEQDPVYLPPIYGQCNPPQCQPGQPCCVPNYCCPPPCQDANKKSETGYGSDYNYNNSKYSAAATTPSKSKADGNTANSNKKSSNNTKTTLTSVKDSNQKQAKVSSESSGSLPTE